MTGRLHVTRTRRRDEGMPRHPTRSGCPTSLQRGPKPVHPTCPHRQRSQQQLRTNPDSRRRRQRRRHITAPRLRAFGPNQPRHRSPRPIDGSTLHRYAGMPRIAATVADHPQRSDAISGQRPMAANGQHSWPTDALIGSQTEVEYRVGSPVRWIIVRSDSLTPSAAVEMRDRHPPFVQSRALSASPSRDLLDSSDRTAIHDDPKSPLTTTLDRRSEASCSERPKASAIASSSSGNR